MKNLADILPLYGVEHEMILSKRGDLTIAYALKLPEIFTLSSAEYELMHQAWLRATRLLPAGTIVHKQDWYTKERFAGEFESERSFLGHSSERFFHERPFLAHRSYLMLTMPADPQSQVNSLFSSLLRPRLAPKQVVDPAFMKSFESACSQFVRLLSDTGLIECRRLGETELVTLVNQYLQLDHDCVRRDMDFSAGIRVGEKYCSLFALNDPADFPANCAARINYAPYSTDKTCFSVGMVASLGQLLPVDHLYQQFLRVSDGTAVMRAQEKRKRRLQSLSAYSRENAVAAAATADFLQEAAAGEHQPVYAHFHLLAWTADMNRVQELRDHCVAALATINVVPKLETVGAPQIFWAGIPGNAADLPVNECFLSFAAPATCFLVSESGCSGAANGFGMRLGERISGRPLQVDISDEPMSRGIITNRNKFIIGPSGSGKSFFTNHLVRSYYEQGTHIVLVDIGHSYKGLCELVGGYYFSYSPSQPIRFNPFHLSEGERIDPEKLESIKTLLVTLWKKEEEQFSRSEYVALSTALQLYYERTVSERSFNSFYEFLSVDYAGVVQKDGVKERDFDLGRFLYVLRPYYRGGAYDYLLNASDQLDQLTERFIVFELDVIKDHPILLPVVTIIIMEVFIGKMRRLQGVRKMIVIEEAWKAIARKGMAEYVLYLYKTVRKHFGEAVVVTQDIEDILSSPVIKQAIINNSDCKILLDQSKYEQRFDEVQALLGLTEKEKTMVLSLNKANNPALRYKEVFISLGGRLSKVYRMEVSPEEYYAYATEEKEKLRVSEAATRAGSMEAGIRLLTNEAMDKT